MRIGKALPDKEDWKSASGWRGAQIEKSKVEGGLREGRD